MQSLGSRKGDPASACQWGATREPLPQRFGREVRSKRRHRPGSRLGRSSTAPACTRSCGKGVLQVEARRLGSMVQEKSANTLPPLKQQRTVLALEDLPHTADGLVMRKAEPRIYSYDSLRSRAAARSSFAHRSAAAPPPPASSTWMSQGSTPLSLMAFQPSYGLPNPRHFPGWDGAATAASDRQPAGDRPGHLEQSFSEPILGRARLEECRVRKGLASATHGFATRSTQRVPLPVDGRAVALFISQYQDRMVDTLEECSTERLESRAQQRALSREASIDRLGLNSRLSGKPDSPTRDLGSFLADRPSTRHQRPLSLEAWEESTTHVDKRLEQSQRSAVQGGRRTVNLRVKRQLQALGMGKQIDAYTSRIGRADVYGRTCRTGTTYVYA